MGERGLDTPTPLLGQREKRLLGMVVLGSVARHQTIIALPDSQANEQAALQSSRDRSVIRRPEARSWSSRSHARVRYATFDRATLRFWTAPIWQANSPSLTWSAAQLPVRQHDEQPAAVLPVLQHVVVARRVVSSSHVPSSASSGRRRAFFMSRLDDEVAAEVHASSASIARTLWYRARTVSCLVAVNPCSA